MFDLQTRQKGVGRPKTTSARAFEMMYAIWRFGSLGTKAIHRMIAPKDSPYGISKELIKLETRGLIEGNKDWQVGFRWFLTPKGYQLLEPIIAERIGVPNVAIEKTVSSLREVERNQWCQFQQDILIMHQVLTVLCPVQEAEAVLMREMSALKIRDIYPWLPKLGHKKPGAIVHWPIGRRGRTFVVDVLPTSQNFSTRVESLRRLMTPRCDLIFFVSEYAYEFDRQNRFVLDHAMRECGITDASKWLVVMQEDLARPSAIVVKDIYGQGNRILGEVLFGKSDTPRIQDVALDRIAIDLAARPKVWGRAYQRAVSKRASGQ